MRYLTLAFGALAVTSTVCAQAVPAVYTTRSHDLDSGYLANTAAHEQVVFRGSVRFEQAQWLHLWMGNATNLAAGSRLRITSVVDRAVQRFDARSLADYHLSSAYFNGNEVTVELIAGPGTSGNRITIDRVDIGDPSGNQYGPDSLCGADDRQLSNDPRQGRQYPTGCTSWMINEFTVLTAGHCTASASQQIHFNVPLSTSSGGLVLPPPQDQYPYESGTLQRLDAGIGSDWSVARTVKNSNTGLYAGQAQGDWYEIGPVPTTTSGNVIRVTGYGTVSSPVSRTWNQVQKTHADALTQIFPTYLRYIPDTTGGNSGSPVVHENTGFAVGIHTHAGCSSGGNHGTRIDRPDTQNAIKTISSSLTVARFHRFGAGCKGTVSTPKLGNLGFPELGQSYSIELTDLRPNQPGALFFGFSNTMSGGVKLPRDLGLIGMPGCDQLISLDIGVGVATGSGSASFKLSVPNSPVFTGARYFTQYFHGDPGANALGLVGTNGAEVVAGI